MSYLLTLMPSVMGAASFIPAVLKYLSGEYTVADDKRETAWPTGERGDRGGPVTSHGIIAVTPQSDHFYNHSFWRTGLTVQAPPFLTGGPNDRAGLLLVCNSMRLDRDFFVART